MGQQQSNINNYVRNNISTTATNNAVLNLEANSEVGVRIEQNITIKFVSKGIVTIKNFSVSQKTVANLKVISTLEEDIGIDFVNDLQAAVSNDIGSTLSATQGALGGVGTSNKANINQVVQNEMTSVIQNEINVNSVRNFFINLDTIQNNEFIVDADEGIIIENLTFDQDFQIQLVSEQMVGTVVDALFENKNVQEALNKLTAELETRQDGVNDVVDSVGEVLGKVMSGFFAPLIIVAVVIAIVVVIFIVLKQTKKPPAPPPAPPPPPPPPPS
jgi:hypothetical protein